MNIEGVLAWSVFDDVSPNLDLKGLLNSSHGANQSLSSAIDFDEQVAEEELLARFMNNVFIYNPVLEEAKVHRYMRDARFNGIGWDAQSCLLVSVLSGASFRESSLKPTEAVDICSWVNWTFRQWPSTRCIVVPFVFSVQTVRVILLRSPKADGPPTLQNGCSGSTVLLPGRSISDGNSASNRSVEDVRSGSCLLPSILYGEGDT